MTINDTMKPPSDQSTLPTSSSTGTFSTLVSPAWDEEEEEEEGEEEEEEEGEGAGEGGGGGKGAQRKWCGGGG